MRCGNFFIVFLLFVMNLSFVISDVGHNASDILISVDGYDMTLQEAVDNGFLKDGAAAPVRDYTTSSLASHSGDEVDVYLGGLMTLQGAIDSGTSFCRDSFGAFIRLLNFGHGGSEVVFEGESLQDKIDGSGFCSYEWKYSVFPAWTETCGSETRTRTVWCERSDGVNVGNDATLCTSPKPDVSETQDFGNSVCGWSGVFTTTSECSYTGSCGVGTLKRTQTCNTPGHCAEPGHDWKGGSCGGYTYAWTTTAWSACNCNFMSETRTVTCNRCDGELSASRYCGYGSKPTAGQGCTGNTGYVNTLTESASGPYLMVCIPNGYSNKGWIANPYKNLVNKNYAYLSCDYNLQRIRCGSSRHDGCVVWFANNNPTTDACYDVTRSNDDCNSVSHQYYYGDGTSYLRSCSSGAGGYCGGREKICSGSPPPSTSCPGGPGCNSER